MPKIIVYDGESEREVALAEQEVTIGRVAKTCDVVIKVPEASRQHCRLKREGSSWFVEDLGSSNGTRVNGRKVTTFELADGDEIQVGKATIRFLESDLVSPPPAADDELELEISLEDECWLKFLSGERAGDRLDLSGRLTFGRRSSNDIALTEKGVSGSHIEIVADGDGWLVRDLGSTNGTLVNGERVVEARLAAGDRIRVGVVELLYGEGEDVGDDLVGTVSFEEVDLGQEVFAISEANFRKKRKSALVLTLFFLIAVLGSGAWWFMQGGKGDAGARRVEVVAGSSLGKAGTFEPGDDEEEALASDSDSLEYDLVTKRPHSGAQALEVSGGGDGDHRIVFLDEILSVSIADRITLGGWVRNAGLSGAAGLELLWKNADGQIIGNSVLNAPEGLGSWTRFEGVFRPPSGSDRAAVAVAYHDASGKLQLDDVYAVRQRQSDEDLDVGEHKILLDRSSSLSISQVGSEVIDLGGFWLLDGDEPRFLDRLFAADEGGASEGKASVTGAFSAAAGLEAGKAEFAVARAEGGILWTGSTQAGGKLHCGMRVALDDGLVTLGADGARRHGAAFERSGVEEIVVASGPRALRLRLGAPGTVRLVESRQGAILLLPLAASDGGRGFSLPIQLDFSAETSKATELMQEAQLADSGAGDYGRAMALYGELINRYSFRKDLADRAAERIAMLSTRAENELDRLERETDDVIFFRTFIADHDRLADALRRGRQAFAGSTYEARYDQILDRLDQAAGLATEESRLAKAVVQLRRGRDLMTPGRSAPVLARGFFESVVLLAPESELAGEARQELDKIAALIGKE
ncbi:MAG: FHA domain-containing protein [Planctomycetes bacterium]|nr:FHA domain-containing protein [Planctomycetota bacterium]